MTFHISHSGGSHHIVIEKKSRTSDRTIERHWQSIVETSHADSERTECSKRCWRTDVYLINHGVVAPVACWVSGDVLACAKIRF